MNFDFSNVPRTWLNNSLYTTHMFNAASIFLPYVEGLVNFSVKNSLDSIQNAKLHDACVLFIHQETQHAREHLKYNMMLRKQGYAFDETVQQIKCKLAYIKKNWSVRSILAFSVAFECFTSIISHIVLKHHLLSQADETMARFWQWHMREELEHQSVLIQLYHEMGGGYFRRIAILTLVLFYYCFFGFKIYFGLLRIDRASYTKGLITACGKQSFFMRSLIQVLRCYRYRLGHMLTHD